MSKYACESPQGNNCLVDASYLVMRSDGKVEFSCGPCTRSDDDYQSHLNHGDARQNGQDHETLAVADAQSLSDKAPAEPSDELATALCVRVLAITLDTLKSAGIETDDPAAGVRELAAQRDNYRASVGDLASMALDLLKSEAPEAIRKGLQLLARNAQPPSDKAPAPEPATSCLYCGAPIVDGVCEHGLICRCREPAEAEPSAPTESDNSIRDRVERSVLPRVVAASDEVLAMRRKAADRAGVDPVTRDRIWPPRTPETAEPAPTRDESVPPPGWAHVGGPYEDSFARGPDVAVSVAEARRIYDAEHGYAPRTPDPDEPAPTEPSASQTFTAPCGHWTLYHAHGWGWGPGDCPRYGQAPVHAEAILREALGVARAFVEAEAQRRVDEGQNNQAMRVLMLIDECPALAPRICGTADTALEVREIEIPETSPSQRPVGDP